MSTKFLEIKNISKKFGNVIALDNVNLSISKCPPAAADTLHMESHGQGGSFSNRSYFNIGKSPLPAAHEQANESHGQGGSLSERSHFIISK